MSNQLFAEAASLIPIKSSCSQYSMLCKKSVPLFVDILRAEQTAQ